MMVNGGHRRRHGDLSNKDNPGRAILQWSISGNNINSSKQYHNILIILDRQSYLQSPTSYVNPYNHQCFKYVSISKSEPITKDVFLISILDHTYVTDKSWYACVRNITDI